MESSSFELNIDPSKSQSKTGPPLRSSNARRRREARKENAENNDTTGKSGPNNATNNNQNQNPNSNDINQIVNSNSTVLSTIFRPKPVKSTTTTTPQTTNNTNNKKKSNANAPDQSFHADSFVTLTHGVTAYRLYGPNTNNSTTLSSSSSNVVDISLIVCLHGLYNSSYMWQDSSDLLCDCEQGPNGQVLIFDFYGHGRSGWDYTPSTLDIFVDQTKELLDVLGYQYKAVSLIGYDIGAAVVVGFAAKYPEFTSSMTLISPVGMRYNRKETDVWTRKSFYTKYLSNETQSVKIHKSIKNEFVSVSLFNEETMPSVKRYGDMIDWQIDHTVGFSDAILSVYNDGFPLANMDELYAAVGRFIDLPALILWGKDDVICPYEKCIKVTEECFLNTVFMIDLNDCGHHPLIEQFDESMNEILSFHKLVFDRKKPESTSIPVVN